MNRRNRSISPARTTTTTRRRLLPRIQYFNRTNPASSTSITSGGDGSNRNNSSTEVTSQSWEFNRRSKEQSRRQCRQQQQRKQQQAELNYRLLEQLHTANNGGEDAEEIDNKEAAGADLAPIDLIEKFELLPDDDSDNVNGTSGNVAVDHDSIFSDETSDGSQVEATTDTKKQKREQPENVTDHLRRKLQEAALAEAMSAPGHSRRQRLATMAVRSGGTTSQPLTSASSNHHHAAVVSPTVPHEPHHSTTLGAFLSSKEQARAGQVGKHKACDQSGISSVTMTVLKHQETENKNKRNNESKQDPVSWSANEDGLNHASLQTTGSEESPISNDSINREDRNLGMNLDLFTSSENDEHRQSPEHSSKEASSSPDGTPFSSCSNEGEERRGSMKAVADSPPNAPSLLCHLPTLGECEYSPITGNQAADSDGGKENSLKKPTMAVTSSPDRSASDTTHTEAETSDDELPSKEDEEIHQDEVDKDDGSEILVTDSTNDADKTCLNNGNKDSEHNVKKQQSGEIFIKKDHNATGSANIVEYSIQNNGSNDLIECSIIEKEKKEEASPATSVDAEPKRDPSRSEPVVPNKMETIHTIPPIAPRVTSKAPINTIPTNDSTTATTTISILSPSAIASNHVERVRQASGGASTPRSFILEKQGWTHHHQYARHREGGSGTDLAQYSSTPVVVPVVLNSDEVLDRSSHNSRVRRDSVVNSTNGNGSAGGGTPTLVVESAKELTELHAWTAELCELRSWKIEAQKSLRDYDKEVASLKHQINQADKEHARVVEEATSEAQSEVELLKGQVSTLEKSLAKKDAIIQKLEQRVKVETSEAKEWKTAAEEAVTESSREIAKLSHSQEELKVENTRLLDKLKSCEKKLTTTEISMKESHSRATALEANVTTLRQQLDESKSAEAKRAMSIEESRELNTSLTKKLQHIQQQLTTQEKESGRQLECTLRRREKEVANLQEKLGGMTKNIAKLGAQLDAANLTKDVMASELTELKKWKINHSIAVANRDAGEEVQKEDYAEVQTLRNQLLLSDYREQISTLRRERDELREQVTHATEKADALQEELNAVIIAKEKIELIVLERLAEDELDESDKINLTKTVATTELEERLLVEQSSGRRLQATIDAKEAELGQLKTEFRQAFSDAEMEISATNLLKDKVVSELSELKKWKSNAESFIEAKTTEISSLQKQMEAESEEKSQLEATIRTKEEQMDRLQAKYEKVVAHATDLQAQLKEATLAKNTAASEVELLKNWKEQHSKLQLDLDHAISDRNKIAEQYQEQVLSLEKCRDTCAAHEETIACLRDELACEQESKSPLTDSILDLENQIDANSEVISKLRGELEDSRAVERLENELRDNKGAFTKKLLEERGPRMDELRRLQASLSDKEKEVDQLKLDLQEATMALKKMQAEVDSLNLVIETNQVGTEKTSAEMMELQDQLRNALDEVAEKSHEISTLTMNVERLEDELRDNEGAFNKKLLEERGPRQDELRRLQTSLSTKEKEASQLKHDLEEATVAARKMESKISSMDLVNETSHAEKEKALLQVVELQEQLNAATDTINEKSDEISTLTLSVERLEKEILDNDVLFTKKLSKERGVRLDETRRLQTSLEIKEKESSQLKNDLQQAEVAARKLQSEIGSLNLIIEPKDAEISALRAKLRDDEENIGDLNNGATKSKEEQQRLLEKISAIERQCEEKQEVIVDRETDISFLQSECEEQKQNIAKMDADMKHLELKLAAAESEAMARLENERVAMNKQMDLLKMDATSKLDVISDLISKNNELIEEVDELSVWKQANATLAEQERMASEILAQKVVDLENELDCQRTKYHNARRALAEMEKALMAVEKQRKKLVQNKSSSDELAWEPGFMEECSSLDGNANFSTSSIWQCESK